MESMGDGLSVIQSFLHNGFPGMGSHTFSICSAPKLLWGYVGTSSTHTPIIAVAVLSVFSILCLYGFLASFAISLFNKELIAMGPAIFKNPWHPRFPMKLLGIEFNIKTLYLHYAYKGPAAREKENEALRARGVLHLHHTGSYQNVENDIFLNVDTCPSCCTKHTAFIP
uniref:Uncharacterized protein n=2 Tax=Xenopus tropicalis TaxID=8364 RepID=A0A1B8Y0W8_XENTR